MMHQLNLLLLWGQLGELLVNMYKSQVNKKYNSLQFILLINKQVFYFTYVNHC